MLKKSKAVTKVSWWQPLMLGGMIALGFTFRLWAQTPTADQLKIFNNLDPATQQTILQNMGQGNGSASTTNSSNNPNNSNTNDNADSARRRKLKNQFNNQKNAQLDDQGNLLPSVLKGEDTVLINIDFPRPKNAVVPATQGQPPQQVVSQTVAVPAPAPEPDKPLSEMEKKKLNELITLIRSKNPYTLTRDGSLLLPGFASMPLAGLSVEQATARVSAEPAFLQLQLTLSLLPLDKSGVAALKPFGYDLFDNAPSTFAPVTDVPVPADYVVGPGDTFNIQLYGNQNRNVKLIVGRDGRISFPELGPISVGGQTFTAVQAELESRVSRQMIGVKASVTMGETRSIRVFVLGEANLPGSYTVSGLSTITAALFASGGVTPIASLRNIQLKRQGTLVRTLDLYDMLLNGDTSNDAKLLPGDVIFIPPVEATVAVAGEVRRPAIYEVKGNQSAAEIIALAGGLTADADVNKVSVTRIDGAHRNVINVRLSDDSDRSLSIHNGDVLNIARMPPTLDSGVTIEGHLYAAHAVAWRDGLRLSDVITSVDDLKPNADIHYLLIRRELPPDRTVAVLSADLAKALANPGSSADVVLMPRDRITVFDFETDRSHVIKPILDELRLQSRIARPTEVVTISGRIKVPGDYPLEPNMKVSDLLRAGGNLQDAAYANSAELVRYQEHNGKRTTELINVDLAAIARGDANADIALQSSDLLSIKELPQWETQDAVTLQGEVRFPGKYAIQRGETLKMLINRAGGLTEQAFAEGSVFTRDDLREREQQQLDLLATRMQSDLTSLALQGSQLNSAQGGQASQALSIGQSLLTQLKTTRAVGRLVIDLDRVIKNPPGSEDDVILRNGDALIVPKQRQEVTVLGEVQTTTSHLYHDGLSRDDYIAQSGGVTRKADKKQIYVVRANGSVIANTSHRWFSGGGTRMKPGDTIVVPLDTERMPALPLWQAVTQIIYNVAIAAAAVNSF